MEGGGSIQARKKALRKEVLARRDAMSPTERMRGDVLLLERILGHQWYYLARHLLCFVSYGSEIDTKELINHALQDGKAVYVPLVEPDEEGKMHRMSFRRIASLGELQEGFHGILEPSKDAEEYRYSEETALQTLLIMPGSAFDLYGNRLGYGGGFYDRFLADKEALRLHSIGVGYASQVVEKLACEPTDLRPYQVITV